MLVATAKAVKVAMDKANSTVTAASNAQSAANTANTNANGRVPNTRKINNKALSVEITLTASDISVLRLSGGNCDRCNKF